MGDPIRLTTVAAIERARAVGVLSELLREAVGEDGLTPYSEEFGADRPDLEPYGTVLDGLRRLGQDPGADEGFDVSMLVGALTRIVAAQQERIEILEKTLAAQRVGKPKASAKKK
jgi:hypothetical protein